MKNIRLEIPNKPFQSLKPAANHAEHKTDQRLPQHFNSTSQRKHPHHLKVNSLTTPSQLFSHFENQLTLVTHRVSGVLISHLHLLCVINTRAKLHSETRNHTNHG